MDLKQVYLVYDGERYDREKVKDEIMEEGYQNYFAFCSDFEDKVDKLKHVAQADEIWVFGKCDDAIEVIFSKEVGKDVWVMG